MHANKDEGLKCLGIARAALAAGDPSKALRFAEKAVKLYRAEETEAFLAHVQISASSAAPSASDATADPASASTAGPAGMGGSTATSGPRRRNHGHDAPHTHASNGGVKVPRHHRSPRRAHAPPKEAEDRSTPEQRELVASIRSKTCYYEILGIARAANDDDIKRAYRRLALRLHPDKNTARGADEAFKSVSRAFTCLSDPQKRQQYDVTGAEPDGAGPAGRQRWAGGQGGPRFTVFDEEIDADEIFRMFFGGNPFMAPMAAAQMYGFGGGGGRGGGVYYGGGGGGRRRAAAAGRAQQHAAAATAESGPLRLLVVLAPVLILLLLQLFGASTPPVSLAQSRRHPYAMATAAHSVPFYVRDPADFAARYPEGSRARARVEYSAESEWREIMGQRCYQDRLRKRRLEMWGQRAKAEQVSLQSCDELQERFGGNNAG